ncbi:DUF397 domain-containing protein [Streptomyces lunaelactis]|uniref:DUF397 domain-containing protein n=1 Tax=Streptomyces lunaelactis TaxID=1535768 RepID=UPI00158581F1|nr:DUF397 domain-containing protein [Streptomyces lunaelactis]NUK14049.1 DUF397 domain-containing protein [Streptomyces lunaelactis]
MMRHDLPEDKWHKSSYSTDNGGQCVEKQTTADRRVGVRDSAFPALGAHVFGEAQWQEFVSAVQIGAV